MTSPNKPQSLREKAEEIANNLVGTNYSVVDLLEAALREAVLEERRRCAEVAFTYGLMWRRQLVRLESNFQRKDQHEVEIATARVLQADEIKEAILKGTEEK